VDRAEQLAEVVRLVHRLRDGVEGPLHLLGVLARGDVLDDADAALYLAVVAVKRHGAKREPDAHSRRRSLVRALVVPLTPFECGDERRHRSLILESPHVEAHELLVARLQDPSQARVAVGDAEIAVEVQDPDRRALEQQPVPLTALLEGDLALAAHGDVASTEQRGALVLRRRRERTQRQLEPDLEASRVDEAQLLRSGRRAAQRALEQSGEAGPVVLGDERHERLTHEVLGPATEEQLDGS
jgi:hypothetical protein